MEIFPYRDNANLHPTDSEKMEVTKCVNYYKITLETVREYEAYKANINSPHCKSGFSVFFSSVMYRGRPFVSRPRMQILNKQVLKCSTV